MERMVQRIRSLPQRIQEAPPSSWGKWGTGLTVGGFGFGYVLFPYILGVVLSQIYTLEQGNDLRRFWNKVPQYFEFNIYVFNITNAEEVQRGQKPKLQEIGPYKYYEIKSKENMIEDDSTDTITYSHMSQFFFRREDSFPLTGEERITIPHLPLLSLLLIAENSFPPALLSIINAAIPGIYGKLDSVFMTVTVKELLFKGIVINCTAKAPVPRTICVALKQNSKPLEKVSENVYRFSILGMRNNTPEDQRITVKRGKNNFMEVGQMVMINGKTENPYAKRGGECAVIKGTDGTVFAPYRQPDNTSIVAYINSLCRAMVGKYEEEYDYRGVLAHKYGFSFGDMENNPSEQCYCPQETKCYKKGIHDLTTCIGAPILASFPHFYDADESYLNGVEGMHPNKEIHESAVMVHGLSGGPLIGLLRGQFSVDFHPFKFVNITRKLPKCLLPILWLEEMIHVDGEIWDFLETMLFSNLRLVNRVQWGLVGAGLAVAAGGVVQYGRKRGQTPVHSLSPSLSARSDVTILTDDSTGGKKEPQKIRDKVIKIKDTGVGTSASLWAQYVRNIQRQGVPPLSRDDSKSSTNSSKPDAGVYTIQTTNIPVTNPDIKFLLDGIDAKINSANGTLGPAVVRRLRITSALEHDLFGSRANSHNARRASVDSVDQASSPEQR